MQVFLTDDTPCHAAFNTPILIFTSRPRLMLIELLYFPDSFRSLLDGHITTVKSLDTARGLTRTSCRRQWQFAF